MLTEKARGATSPFEEDVRGVIVEVDMGTWYEFWTYPDPAVNAGFAQDVGRGWFENDEAAIAWLRANVPPGTHIEMRVFDRR